MRRADIVDENVRVRSLRKQGGRSFRGREIGGDPGQPCLWEQLAHLPKRCGDPLLAAAIDHDRSAGARQSFRNRSADACCGPRDNRFAALKLDVHGAVPLNSGIDFM